MNVESVFPELPSLVSQGLEVNAAAVSSMRVRFPEFYRNHSGPEVQNVISLLTKRIIDCLSQRRPHEVMSSLVLLEVMITTADFEQKGSSSSGYLHLLWHYMWSKASCLVCGWPVLDHSFRVVPQSPLSPQILDLLLQRESSGLSELINSICLTLSKSLSSLRSSDPLLRVHLRVLSAVASHARRIFAPFVSEFIAFVCPLVSNDDAAVRESTSHLLGASLDIVEQCKNFCPCYDVLAVLRLNVAGSSVPALHGALLVYKEILDRRLDFFKPYYSSLLEALEPVLSSATDPQLRRSLLSIIPSLAAFNAKCYPLMALQPHFSYLLTSLSGDLRLEAFASIDKVIALHAESLSARLPDVLSILLSSLPLAPYPAARTAPLPPPCSDKSVLTRSLLGLYRKSRPLIKLSGVRALEILLFLPFDDFVVEIFDLFCRYDRALSLHTQELLLTKIAFVLISGPFYASDQNNPIFPLNNALLQRIVHWVRENSSVSSKQWALNLLGRFPFRDIPVLNFVVHEVLPLLFLSPPELYDSVVLSCLGCVRLHLEEVSFLPLDACSQCDISTILQQVLKSCLLPVSDKRLLCLRHLSPVFDPYLASADIILLIKNSMFSESLEVERESTLIFGRLNRIVPDYAFLGRFLVEQQSLMECSISGSHYDSILELMGLAISFLGPRVAPWSDSIESSLVREFSRHAQNSPSLSVIDLLYQLSQQTRLRRETALCFVPHVSKLIVHHPLTKVSDHLISVLMQLCRSSGISMVPYTLVPELYPYLLSTMSSNCATDRCEIVMKFLGDVGLVYPTAIGPKRIESDSLASGNYRIFSQSFTSSVSDRNRINHYTSACLSLLFELSPAEISTSGVLSTVFSIIHQMGEYGRDYLSGVFPKVFRWVEKSDNSVRRLYYDELFAIIPLVRTHLKPFLRDMFQFFHAHFDEDMNEILPVLTQIATFASEGFCTHFLILSPDFLSYMRGPMQDIDLRNRFFQSYVHFLPYLGSQLSSHVSTLMDLLSVKNDHGRFLQSLLQILGMIFEYHQLPTTDASLLYHLMRIFEIESNHNLMESVDRAICSLLRSVGTPIKFYLPQVVRLYSERGFSSLRFNMIMERFAESASLFSGTSVPPMSPRPLVCKPLVFGNLDELLLTSKWNPDQYPIAESPSTPRFSPPPSPSQYDWSEWFHRVVNLFIQNSPVPAIQNCHTVAQISDSFQYGLFNFAFLSCWEQLSDSSRSSFSLILRRVLTEILSPEILSQFLSLIDFLDHQEIAFAPARHPMASRSAPTRPTLDLPLDLMVIHYSERLFDRDSLSSSESIYTILEQANLLNYTDYAHGLLDDMKSSMQLPDPPRGVYLEMLKEYVPAKGAYQADFDSGGSSASGKTPFQSRLGLIRCASLTGYFDLVSSHAADLGRELSSTPSAELKSFVIDYVLQPLAALGSFDQMKPFLDTLNGPGCDDSFKLSLFQSLYHLAGSRLDRAQWYLARARSLFRSSIPSYLSEGYPHAHKHLSSLVHFSELERIIQLKGRGDPSSGFPGNRKDLVLTWRDKYQNLPKDPQVRHLSLVIRSQLLSPHVLLTECIDEWLELASLSSKCGYWGLCKHSLGRLGWSREDKEAPDLRIHIELCKYYWRRGHSDRALKEITKLTKRAFDPEFLPLMVRSYHYQSLWKNDRLHPRYLLMQKLDCCHEALKLDSRSAPTWHDFGTVYTQYVERYSAIGQCEHPKEHFVHEALHSFFRSIELSGDANPYRSFQDTLQVISFMFLYSETPEIHSLLVREVLSTPLSCWLKVVPQLVAGIGTQDPALRQVLQILLQRIVRERPDMLIYPLHVCTCSSHSDLRNRAESLFEYMSERYPDLVRQSRQFCTELGRIAISKEEIVITAYERVYPLLESDRNYSAAYKSLSTLVSHLSTQPSIKSDAGFMNSYRSRLDKISLLLDMYSRTKDESHLDQLMQQYLRPMYQEVNSSFRLVRSMNLATITPQIMLLRDTEMPIPLHFSDNRRSPSLKEVKPLVVMMVSKLRPRRLSLMSEGGTEHQFLLKGREDIRQDERVMQFFDIVNHILLHSVPGSDDSYSIRCYSTVPISPIVGIIEWVPSHDTVNDLIYEYRTSHSIDFTLEVNLMNQRFERHKLGTRLQRYEGFNYILHNTPSSDLRDILWLKSPSCESWLSRRQIFTRSLAVMSIVGYILGLGDRHFSNIMIDRDTGKACHIDFGDCFEVAQHRQISPEKVPFRLTRMMISAMEVCGYRGTFRLTCERVMAVLRKAANRSALMVLLDVFVRDPVTNWRLLQMAGDTVGATNSRTRFECTAPSYPLRSVVDENDPLSYPRAKNQGIYELQEDFNDGEEVRESLQVQAQTTLERISDKLQGKDFRPHHLTPSEQVDVLIQEATSFDNLAEAFEGWCPFW